MVRALRTARRRGGFLGHRTFSRQDPTSVYNILPTQAIKDGCLPTNFEFRPRIHVNGVAPGGMSTDLRRPQSIAHDESNASSLPLAGLLRHCTPLRQLAEPANFTAHLVPLASEKNSGTKTGAIINCDGGNGIYGLPDTAWRGESLSRLGRRYFLVKWIILTPNNTLLSKNPNL
ncbi:hypothetical protein [Rhodococcus sp. NCIMB 12038]|uniref:hypothetical protein n=1 Tax=Rhodococcus sp. NCIMB 12038 TaxID=933800 RepID=UPI000B3CD7BA|nr:hypothetical protein [Rhodococcus sp. NCIMB 12038]OUS92840.1 hypothetical protein CA951_26245 [Rhodococcus sp. NCIMB 12038]